MKDLLSGPLPRLGTMLDRLVDEGLVDDRETLEARIAPALAPGSPILVDALAGFGTWVAAAFFVAALVSLRWIAGGEESLIGGLLLTLGAAIVRRRVPSWCQGFHGRLLLALGLAGQLLALSGLFSLLSRQPAALLFALLLGVVATIDPGRMQAFLAAFVTAGMAFIYFEDLEPYSFEAAAISTLGLLVAVEAGLSRLDTLPVDRLRSAEYGLLGALMLLLLPSSFPDLLTMPPPGPLTTIGLAAIALTTLVRRRSELGTRPTAVAAGVLLTLTALTLDAPGILASLLLLALGFHRRRRAILGLGAAFLVLFCVGFYYSLDLRLMHKSLLLAATAGVLLLTRGLWLGKGPADESRTRPAGLRRTGFWAGWALAILVLVGWTASQEIRLQSSSPVLLRLVPVDPRSLLQGDFMRLRYQLEDELTPLASSRPPRGRLVVRPDDRGVAGFVRWYDPDRPLADGERLMRYRIVHGRLDLGHHTFFFEEGRGRDLAAARYAEIRLDGFGNGVLSALLGEDLSTLVRH